MNPLLNQHETIPSYHLIKAEHVAEAIEVMVSEVEKAVLKIESSDQLPSWQSVIEPLNLAEDWYARVWAPISHLNMVKNQDDLRVAYSNAQPKVVALGLKIEQSKKLYEKYKVIRNSAEWQNLDNGQKRSIEKRILSAELSGISLEGKVRERFNEIERQLSNLSTEFSNNVLDSTKDFKLVISSQAECGGLTDSVKEMLAYSYALFNLPSDASVEKEVNPSEGPWLVTLDGPVFMAFMQYSNQRHLREKLYRAYVTRASSGTRDNSPIMEKILELRAEKSKILGYPSYAHVSLASKMAPSIDAVFSLLDELLKASLNPARAELKEMTELAQKGGHLGDLKQWDVAFWAKRLEEEKFNYTDEILRPYFPLGNVLKGLFKLTSDIFNVRVENADGDAPIWHKDVSFYKIFDDSNSHIASFYLDPYSRPENKRGGAWMNDVVGRRVLAKEFRAPVAHLVCNFTPPVAGKPSLLTFDEVETMFHEFGHGLQHMLTHVDYADVSGINGVEWDAVELPSQFMENWCYHKETLLGMAKHFETGETLPIDLFEKIYESRSFRAGMLTLRQLTFGLTDLALHMKDKPSIREIEQDIAKKTAIIPPLPEDRSLCSFSHIFSGGYAAGYYSYFWAEVLSADAFEAFQEVGLENKAAIAKVGTRFKETVLGLGGSRHPGEIYKMFRGRDPSPHALLRQKNLVS